MRKYDEYNYTVPHWAAYALTSGDENLSDEESKQLDNFLDNLPDHGQGCFDFGDDEPDFHYYNDVDKLGSDCYKATYTVFLD